MNPKLIQKIQDHNKTIRLCNLQNKSIKIYEAAWKISIRVTSYYDLKIRAQIHATAKS